MQYVRRQLHFCLLTALADLDRVQNDSALNDAPLFFGEWSLATQFNTTDEFRAKWSDAQKYAYTQGAGWIVSLTYCFCDELAADRSFSLQFWNFKFEDSAQTVADGDYPHAWSYFIGVEKGILTKDPSQLHNPDICVPYIGATSTATSTTAAETHSGTASVTNSAASTETTGTIESAGTVAGTSSSSASAADATSNSTLNKKSFEPHAKMAPGHRMKSRHATKYGRSHEVRDGMLQF